MSRHESARRANRLLPVAFVAILLVVGTCCAQHQLTQLVTRKPKPAPPTPVTAVTPAGSAAQPASTPSTSQVIPLPEVAMQLEQLTQSLINVSASLPADDQ